MNILLVTQSVQDARLIEHELAKRMPGLHIDIAHEVRHGIEKLVSPGGFRAVLLDASLPEGDRLAVIKAACAQNSPIPVIGLVGNDDVDSGAKLAGSGAADFVIKGAAFVDALAAALRRACAGPPRVLYAPGGVDSLPLPGQNSLKPDTAGATRVLVRNNESGAARNFATRVTADLKESQHQPDDSRRQIERRPIEQEPAETKQRQQNGEEERLRLQEALRAAESTLSEQARLFQSEREKLQSEWERFRNLLDASEEQQKSMGEGLREKETARRRAEELQTRALREHDLEQQLQAAEKERTRLLGVLRGLEVQVVGLTEELRRERKQGDTFRQALNQKLAEVEGRRDSLERAVLEGEQQRRKLSEQHAAELSRSEGVRRELEKRYQNGAAENARLQASLRAGEDRIAGLLEQHRMETGRWESAGLALEQQNRALQERVAQLEEANSSLEREHGELLAQLEASRIGLENHAGEMADELRRIVETHNDWAGKRRSELAELKLRMKSAGKDPDLARRDHDSSLKTGNPSAATDSPES